MTKRTTHEVPLTRVQLLRKFSEAHLFREKSLSERFKVGFEGVFLAPLVLLLFGKEYLRRLNSDEIEELKSLLKLLQSDEWDDISRYTQVITSKRTTELATRQTIHKRISFCR
jgi:hypothetical protein